MRSLAYHRPLRLLGDVGVVLLHPRIAVAHARHDDLRRHARLSQAGGAGMAGVFLPEPGEPGGLAYLLPELFEPARTHRLVRVRGLAAGDDEGKEMVLRLDGAEVVRAGHHLLQRPQALRILERNLAVAETVFGARPGNAHQLMMQVDVAELQAAQLARAGDEVEGNQRPPQHLRPARVRSCGIEPELLLPGTQGALDVRLLLLEVLEVGLVLRRPAVGQHLEALHQT